MGCYESLVPPIMLRLWQCTGLLACPVRTVGKSSAAYRIATWLLPAWAIFIFLLYGYFYAIEITIFTKTYEKDLIDLEFFTMLLLLYREYFFILPLPILLWLFTQRQIIKTLIRSIQVSVGDLLNSSQMKTIRIYHYVAFVFMLVVATVSAFCNYAGFLVLMSETHRIFPTVILKWSSLQPVAIIPGGFATYALMGTFYGTAFAFSTICYNAPAALIVGFALAIGLGFASIEKELKKISAESNLKRGNIFDICERMAQIRDDHRQLRGAVGLLNASVGTLMVFITFGDIMMPISLISRLLQDPPTDVLASIQDKGTIYPVYFFSVCAIFQGVVRIWILVWMHENATRCKVHLHHIGLQGVNEAVRDSARNFEQEVMENPEELAVSCHGFFSVTRNFAATLFGLVLTYFLLIYQQKDQKGDLDKISRQQQVAFLDLAAKIDELRQSLNGTQLVFAHTVPSVDSLE